MSVLIKGMMMPVNCQTCPFVKDAKYAATPEYEVVIDLRCGLTQMLADNPAFERNKDCPLEEKDEMAVNEKYNEMVKEILELEEKVGFFSLTRRERNDFQYYVERRLEE